MDYYRNAEEPLEAAVDLKNLNKFRMSVTMSTLAIDLLLKSVLYRLDPANDLIMGHNHQGILKLLELRYPPSNPGDRDNLRLAVNLSRKYFKDSRYSSAENFLLFDEEMAARLIYYAQLVKNYVDNDCQATLEDLTKKFGKQADYH